MSGKLDEAYSLQTPDDSVALYRDWASSYDKSFGEDLGYVLPDMVARAFKETVSAELGTILDVGVGTGLLGANLSGFTCDGLDISQDMLDVAASKKIYRRLIQADLSKSLAIADQSYEGIVSSGTFTSGHVGPDCLPELLRIARPGALFALSINLQVFDRAGFGSAFARLVARQMISPLQFRDVSIYEKGDHPHADDRCVIALFHRS